MQFKHGDKVTCEINGTKITDARISINEFDTPYICQNIVEGVDCGDKLGYQHSWAIRRDFTAPKVTNLRLAKKDIADITTYEVVEMTVEEVSKALGKTVKIIKG